MESLRKLITKKLLILVLIFLIAFFFRFYDLGSIPAGLTNDEANTGYDSYSLLLTAKDQWGTFLPFTNFKGFGDYPPPIYRYLSILPVYFFDLNQFSVRFVSALFGFFSVIALFFLSKKLFNEKIALFSSLLFAIMPWAIGLSRVAIESNAAIFFLLIAVYFGFNNKKNISRNLLLSVLFLGLSAYTYSAYSLFVPLVFFLSIINNFYKTKIKIKNIILPLILIVVIMSPIFIKGSSASVRFSQVGLSSNINSIGLINNLNDQRGQCIKTYPDIICKSLENKPVLFTQTFIKNYLSHFSLNLLYLSGTVTQFSILPFGGLDYWISFLFLIFGIYALFSKERKNTFIVGLLLFSVLPDSLTSDGNYSRASIMQPFMAMIGGIGLSFATNEINKKKKWISKSLNGLIILIFVFLVASFWINYTTYFKNNYSIHSQYGYEELMSRVSKEKNNYDKIYISRHLNDAKQYVYYLFYTKYDPIVYQSKKDVSYSMEGNGWISIDRIENIFFVQTPPSNKEVEQMSGQKVLIISAPVDFAKEINAKFEVKDKLGDILFKAVELQDLLKYNKEHPSVTE